MKKHGFIHYTDIGKNCLDINCSECGHEFKYGETTPKFCPNCGTQFESEKYNNIPMDIVPRGIKGWLYKKYDVYNEYYNDSDNWQEIIAYLKIIYNPTHIERIVTESGLRAIVKGYSLKNNKEICFISEDENFIGFYTNPKKNKADIEIYSTIEFKKELLN